MSKLNFSGKRLDILAVDAIGRATRALAYCGCPRKTASMVAEHLVDASLCGVESHGLMRILQYVAQFNDGDMIPDASPQFRQGSLGSYEIDGNHGIGILSMNTGVKEGCRLAKENGISAIAIRNTGHTGRLGAFAEQAADQGCMMIIIGGGNRKKWPQVAPHGGRQAVFPTNPYCIGIPGGDRGPIVMDFATAKIAGGWIYAAKSAGALLPEDAIIDNNGYPSIDPDDYFNGGAILPAGGAKGYSLALVAELMAEAMLGPATTECNWLMITLNTAVYRESSAMQCIAEEILEDCRGCPPAAGFTQVEIPGERERERKMASRGMIAVPEETWKQILDLDILTD
ncbi:MAG: hypothetical protein GKR95_11295 [Gammaproteobacteria bacterium]|nr:hypothetical protein [Gammaproteobacteria bacterium]